MKVRRLWGSAPTLDGIQQVITAFYCGCVKTLRQVNETEWAVVNSDGTDALTVVRLRKGRYRFESKSK